MADEETLKKRKIIKVRRPGAAPAAAPVTEAPAASAVPAAALPMQAAPSTVAEPASVNPFAGITLSVPSSLPTPAANPFAGVLCRKINAPTAQL